MTVIENLSYKRSDDTWCSVFVAEENGMIIFRSDDSQEVERYIVAVEIHRDMYRRTLNQKLIDIFKQIGNDCKVLDLAIPM